MRAVVLPLLLVSALGCGAQPNQPALANVPKPNPAAVAGGAAAAAAAITLASPDSHNPEKRQNTEKKPIKVKENVPADVLDRADSKKADAADTTKRPDAAASAKASPTPAANSHPKAQPAGTEAARKAPRDALDFSND